MADPREVPPALAAAGIAGPIIFFPLREDAAGVTFDPLGVHTVNGAIFFLSIGVGLVVLLRRLAGDPSWRGLSGYVLAGHLVGLHRRAGVQAARRDPRHPPRSGPPLTSP